MRNITTVFLIAAALATGACQNSENFAAHAEIMAAYTGYEKPEPVKPKTASNVVVGAESVWVFHSDAEFVLAYCGEVTVEMNGKQNEPVEASVFQLEPGVWVAELGAGQYIKVFAASGVTNCDIDGEFRVFAKP